jgi:mono/diheme cytochrome c family protein
VKTGQVSQDCWTGTQQRRLPRILISALGSLVLWSSLQAGAAQPSVEANARPGRDWAVDPTVPGENLPPVGRSLFDFLVVRNEGHRKVYHVPFPFSALVKKLGSELQPERAGVSPIKSVLIPLGRSLQRTAAAPEFFAYPRVVVAPDGEPRTSSNHTGMLLKDRIFLGYHEKAEVIEVISFNEAAGRFEFQVVKDYRPGGVPQVFYANRTICTSCHQNAAPVFPRQLWDETNANRGIAAALLREKRSFYGIAADRGVDVPYGLDNATDRANLFAAYQLLWRDGCEVPRDPERSARCRAGLFLAALQHRLSGRQQFDGAAASYREHVVPTLARNAREYWAAGLAIPNPDLPNRDPLVPSAITRALSRDAGAMQKAFSENVDVHAAFDPLAPRAPSEIWQIAEHANLTRLIGGLAEFIAEPDARRLSAHLSRQALSATTARTTYQSGCELMRSQRSRRAYRLDFQCAPQAGAPHGATLQGRLYVEGRSAVDGSIDRLRMSDGAQTAAELRDIDIAPAAIAGRGVTRQVALRLTHAGTQVRRGDGNAVETLHIAWDEPAPDSRSTLASATFRGRATLTITHDFAPVVHALESMIRDTIAAKLDVFSSRPFRRASLMPILFERTGMKALTWCCVNDTGMPAPVMEGHTTVAHARAEAEAKPVALQPFFRYCATCHQSNDRSPPNFLQGPSAAVTSNIAHCAQRLHVRLSMWSLAPEHRPKTPMPPHYALYTLQSSPEAWPESTELAALRTYVERVLQAQNGKAPRPEELLSRGYENLRPCLPEAN